MKNVTIANVVRAETDHMIRAQIEAFTARRLELVDLLFVLREGRGVDLDAGRLLEIGKDRVRILVRPHEDRDLA